MNKKLLLSFTLVTLSIVGLGEQTKPLLAAVATSSSRPLAEKPNTEIYLTRWVENNGVWESDSTGRKLIFTPLTKQVGVNGEWADDGTWISYW